MRKLIINLTNLRFYKYLRLIAVLIGVGVIFYVELFAFPEPVDASVDWEQLQREAERAGRDVYGDNETGKISIKNDGNITEVEVWNPDTREWERVL